MRIERSGPVEPLTPRLVSFLKEALGGVSMDDIQNPEQLRIDYTCLNGLVAIELKSLEEDGSARMDNLTDELRQRDDWPAFLGSAPIQSFIKHTKDPEGLNKRVLDRIGRGIINHLKKANRQLEAHCASFPRRNVVRVLLLVNEDHEAYDPNTVSYILWHAIRRVNEDRPLYEHVDLIIYMTERHAQVVDNRLAFPTLIIESPNITTAPWKSDVGQLFVERWAKWNNNPLHRGEVDPASFTTIDHIPESAPRHERWRTDYRRAPYLRPLTFEQLRQRFDEITLMSSFSFLKGSPIPMNQEATMNNMINFTHMMVEMGERGIPITQFAYETDRAVAAARRLGLPQNAIDWTIEMDSHRGST